MYISDRLPSIRAALTKGEISLVGRRPNLYFDLPSSLREQVRLKIGDILQPACIHCRNLDAVVDGFLRLYANLNLLAFRVSYIHEPVADDGDATANDAMHLVRLYTTDIISCRGHLASIFDGTLLVTLAFPYGVVPDLLKVISPGSIQGASAIQSKVREFLRERMLNPAPAPAPAPVDDKCKEPNLVESPVTQLSVSPGVVRAGVQLTSPELRGSSSLVLAVPNEVTHEGFIDDSGIEGLPSIDIAGLRLAIADYLQQQRVGERGAVKAVFMKMLATIYEHVVVQASISGKIVLGTRIVDTNRLALRAIPQLIDAHIGLWMKVILSLPDMLIYEEQVEIVRALIVQVSFAELAYLLYAFGQAFENPAFALLQMVREAPIEPLVWLTKNKKVEKVYYRINNTPDHNQGKAIAQLVAPKENAKPKAGGVAPAKSSPSKNPPQVSDDEDQGVDDAEDAPAQEEPSDGCVDATELAEVERLAVMPVGRGEAAHRDIITGYLTEIRRLPVLSHQEIVALSTKYQALLVEVVTRYQATLPNEHPDKDIEPQKLNVDVINTLMTPAMTRIRNRIWEHNLRLVVGIARRYNYSKLPFPDRIQEGNLGLIVAINRFDPRRGYHFSTYATWWIRQGVTRAIADHGRTVRMPVHLLESINKYYRIFAELSHKYDRHPTDEEMSAVLGWNKEKLATVRGAISTEISTDAPMREYSDKPGATRGDLLENKGSPVDVLLADKERSNHVREALRNMSAVSREVLVRRYGIDREEDTLLEIGSDFGLTRERVRQLEEKAEAELLETMKGTTNTLAIVKFGVAA